MRGRMERLPPSTVARASLPHPAHSQKKRATFAHKSSTAHAPLLAAPPWGGIRQAASCTNFHPTLMSLHTLEATPGSKASQARQGKAGNRQGEQGSKASKQRFPLERGTTKKVPKKPQKVFHFWGWGKRKFSLNWSHPSQSAYQRPTASQHVIPGCRIDLNQVFF